MKKMRLYGLLCLALLHLSCGQKTANNNEQQPEPYVYNLHSDYDSARVLNRLSSEVLRVNAFLQKRGTTYARDKAILIDMHIPSKYFRLFVVDLQSGAVLSRGLVCHGSGSEITGSDSLQFSNTPNSYMTSLGMYKIGGAYQGNFGRSYKLHGLEATNDKAFERAIVLHRYQCVPDEEQYYPICNSLGCAMVSENYFETLETYIDASKKPMLMNIYY